MAVSKISSARLVGVGACVPKKVLKISEYGKFSADKAAIFTKRAGVSQRRFAENITASDMCLAAAEALIADLKWDKSEISGLIFVSQSRDYPLPATACILQDRLGLPKSCLAFDICLGCSGYVYGLSVAASMVSAMRLRKVLLLVGENTLMQHTPENVSAYPLFGDAGTATALSYDPSAPDIFANLRTDGDGYKSIIVERGGVRNPVRPNDDSFDFFPLDGGGRMRLCDCLVDGAAIMDFCLREVKPCVEELLAFAETGIDSIDAVYAHQANLLINETVRKMCKIPAEKHPYNIGEFGNTSCASVPLLMSTRGAAELSGGARRNMLLGFGVGLSWGGIILETDKISCPPLVEI